MIEVYVPFLLVLLSWHPGDPQRSMEVTQRVFLNIQECEVAGQEIERLRAGQPTGGRQFAWKCVPQEREIEVYRPLPQQP